MEQFIQRRLRDPRFAAADSSVKPWYQSTSYVREKHVFNEMPKNNRKKRESESESESSSSSSSEPESDGEGESNKNKKKGRCWEGYEPTPGKKPYTDGSCQKKKKSH